jgi:hypothetical protein
MWVRTERLLHHRGALGALLTGELGSHGNDGIVMHGSIGIHPPEELPPSGIMNALRQLMVAGHIADLQVFIGKETREM